MRTKTTVWYTLGEAEKATGIQRTRLDHACRVGRLPYRRSETGARLLSHDVVEKLRKEGLKSFPRPYDPIASSNEQVASPAGVTQGMGPTAQRERVEQKRGELEELRIDRDLRQQREKERQEKAERLAAAAAERHAQAEERAQAQRQSQELRLEEERQAQAREQAEWETEARLRRQEWETSWLDYALKLLPGDLPQSLELDVHQVVADLLPKLDALQPQQLTQRLIQRLIQAAIDKALQPWHKRKEIEKIIEETRDQLPAHVRSWSSTPNEWEARAMCAAADAISQLGEDAQLVKIRAAAIEAGTKVREQYEVWKAGEDHRQSCEQIVQWVFFGDDAREAVRQALEKLPVGVTRAKMENARDAALAPFRAAARAVADADQYLHHVNHYVEELGNEDTGEWDLGGWSKGFELAKKLKIKLRPALIRKLSEDPMDENEAYVFIEEWLDRELELED